MNPVELAQALREGGQVQRMHCTPHLQPYSVAQHSWGMAMLLRALHPQPSQELLWAVLTHDVAERWTGDIPSPLKWDIAPGVVPALRQAELRIGAQLDINIYLTEEENNWLCSLDLAELWVFCKEELRMGNTNVVQMINTCYKLLLDRSWTPGPVLKWALDYNQHGKRFSDFLGVENGGDTPEGD